MESRSKSLDYKKTIADLTTLKNTMIADLDRYQAVLLRLTKKQKKTRKTEKERFIKSLEAFIIAAREATIDIMLRIENDLKENEPHPTLTEEEKAIIVLITNDERYDLIYFYRDNSDPFIDPPTFNTTGIMTNTFTKEAVNHNEAKKALLKHRKVQRQAYTMGFNRFLINIFEGREDSLEAFDRAVPGTITVKTGSSFKEIQVTIKDPPSFLPEETFWLHIAKSRFGENNIVDQIFKCAFMMRVLQFDVSKGDVELIKNGKHTPLYEKLENLGKTTLINLSKKLINTLQKNNKSEITKKILSPSEIMASPTKREIQSLTHTIEYLLKIKQEQLAKNIVDEYQNYCKNLDPTDENVKKLLNELQASYEISKIKYDQSDANQYETVIKYYYDENKKQSVGELWGRYLELFARVAEKNKNLILATECYLQLKATPDISKNINKLMNTLAEMEYSKTAALDLLRGKALKIPGFDKLNLNHPLFSDIKDTVEQVPVQNDIFFDYPFLSEVLAKTTIWCLPAMLEYAKSTKKVNILSKNDPIFNDVQFGTPYDNKQQFGTPYTKRRILLEILAYQSPTWASQQENESCKEIKRQARVELVLLMQDEEFNKKFPEYNLICEKLIDQDPEDHSIDTIALENYLRSNSELREWIKDNLMHASKTPFISTIESANDRASMKYPNLNIAPNVNTVEETAAPLYPDLNAELETTKQAESPTETEIQTQPEHYETTTPDHNLQKEMIEKEHDKNQMTESRNITPEDVKNWKNIITKYIKNSKSVFKPDRDVFQKSEFEDALKKHTFYYQEKFYEIISKIFDEIINKKEKSDRRKYDDIVQEMINITPTNEKDIKKYYPAEFIDVATQLSTAAYMLQYYSSSNESIRYDALKMIKKADYKTAKGLKTSRGLPDGVTAIYSYEEYRSYANPDYPSFTMANLMKFYDGINPLKSNEYFISDQPKTFLRDIIEQLKGPFLSVIDAQKMDYQKAGHPKPNTHFYNITSQVIHNLMKYYHENDDIDSVVSLHQRCAEYFSLFDYKKHLNLIFEIDAKRISQIENPNDKMAYIDECLNNPDKKRFAKYFEKAIEIAEECNRLGKVLQYLVQNKNLYYEERPRNAIDKKIKEVCEQLIANPSSNETKTSLREILLRAAVNDGFKINDIEELENKYRLFSTVGLKTMANQVIHLDKPLYFYSFTLQGSPYRSLPSLYKHAMNETTQMSEPNDPILTKSQYVKFGKEYHKRRILMEIISYEIPDNASNYENEKYTEYKKMALTELNVLANENAQSDFNRSKKTSGFNIVCRSFIESTDGIDFNRDTFQQKITSAQLANEIFKNWLKKLDLSQVDEKNIILNTLKIVSAQPQPRADDSKQNASYSYNPVPDLFTLPFDDMPEEYQPTAPKEKDDGSHHYINDFTITNENESHPPSNEYGLPPEEQTPPHSLLSIPHTILFGKLAEPISDSVLNQRQTDYKVATISLNSLDDKITKLKDKIDIAKNQITALEKVRDKYINKKDHAKDHASIEQYKTQIKYIISNIEETTREMIKVRSEKDRVKIERVKKETEVKTLESKIQKKP